MASSSTFSSPSHWLSLTMESKGSANECTVRDQMYDRGSIKHTILIRTLNPKQKVQMKLSKTKGAAVNWFYDTMAVRVPRASMVHLG